MALIKCPECGKEVSDKAAACIHCGYPLSNKKEKYYKVLLPSIEELGKKTAIAARISSEILNVPMHEITDQLLNRETVIVQDGLTLNQAKLIEQKFTVENISVQVLESETDIDSVTSKENSFIIACPKCGSTEYHAGARGFSLVTGFVGSGKTVLTCLKCGHRWKPGK